VNASSESAIRASQLASPTIRRRAAIDLEEWISRAADGLYLARLESCAAFPTRIVRLGPGSSVGPLSQRIIERCKPHDDGDLQHERQHPLYKIDRNRAPTPPAQLLPGQRCGVHGRVVAQVVIQPHRRYGLGGTTNPSSANSTANSRNRYRMEKVNRRLAADSHAAAPAARRRSARMIMIAPVATATAP
jgi:hypothetical protein